jgi:methyl-accepting chemotaxis protein
MYNVTWPDLGIVILFLVSISVGIYLFILVRNLNSTVKVLKGIIEDNGTEISKTLKDLPVITENMIEITETAKNELKAMEGTINSISETAELTVGAANTIKGDLLGKIKSILEIIEAVKKFFFKEKKDDVSEVKE